MKNFRSGGFRGDRSGGRGGRSFGEDRSFNRDRGPRTMHDAICSKCGAQCQVPFEPNGSKPIYCKDCFRPDDQGGNDRSAFRPRPSFGQRDFTRAPREQSRVDLSGVEEQLTEINNKLDAILMKLQGE